MREQDSRPDRTLGQGKRPAWPGPAGLGPGKAASAHMQAERSNSWAPRRRPRRALLPMQQVSRLHLGTSSRVARAPGPARGP